MEDDREPGARHHREVIFFVIVTGATQLAQTVILKVAPQFQDPFQVLKGLRIILLATGMVQMMKGEHAGSQAVFLGCWQMRLAVLGKELREDPSGDFSNDESCAQRSTTRAVSGYGI